MRVRYLKPSFFVNESLAECAPLTRILFAGLWCLADRDGRLEDRPAQIKALLLPYDSCSIGEMLEELATRNHIIRYEVASQKLIEIPSFLKHGHAHKDEKTGNYPPPAGKNGGFPEITCSTPSLLPSTPSPSLSLSPVRECACFDSFWDQYPKKTAKVAAAKAWEALQPSPELLRAMLAALEIQSHSLAWTRDGGRYVPNAANWLSNRRWEDDPTSYANSTAKAETKEEKAERHRRALEERQRNAEAAKSAFRGSLKDLDKKSGK